MHRYLRRGAAPGFLSFIAIVSVLWAGLAGAQPYEFVAVYEPTSPAGQAHTIRLTPSEDAYIPDGGESHQLDRIVVRFKSDGMSVSNLGAFRALKFKVKFDDAEVAYPEIQIADVEKLPGRESTLMRWHGDGKTGAMIRVKIEVESIFTSAFLCLQEMALLGDDKNKARFNIPSMQLRSTSSKEQSRTGIKVESGIILFTFCKNNGEDLNLQVDWAKALNAKPNPYAFSGKEANGDPDLFRRAQKKGLADKIVSLLNERFEMLGRSAVVDTEDPHYEHVLIEVKDSYAFSVIKAAGSLLLAEETGSDVQPLADLIDQDSKVSLGLARDVCPQSSQGELMRSPWVFELETPDKEDNAKTKTSIVSLGYRHGCNRVLLVQWKDYLNQRVTFRVIYRIPEHEDIVVFKDSFQVYNIGLITTAPVISEIVSAIQGDSPNDVEAHSSIPVSWAMSVREDRPGSYAVTFPFTISLNTRTFPDLASYVALAPSISLIGGSGVKDPAAGESTSVRAAFGVGVNLARAFHFGYAWAPTDGGRYVLIGLSVPDLLPLLRKDE